MDLSILYRGPLSSCNYGCEYCPFAKHSETAAEHKEDERALNRFVSWVSNRDADNIRNRPDTGGGGLRDVGVYVMGVTSKRFNFTQRAVNVTDMLTDVDFQANF